MTNSYPPYWEGQIGIAFTREEWEAIINTIEYYTNFRYGFDEDFVVERNIVDRIQKNLGIE